ncbi:hypothetical protein GCM10018793_47030 [Streptomyces sulfonofaciens]|uniref:Phenyloxazoline synthase MbtB n=1 Tax=Streptomyces sulfonofaciens TaxID=68272 RepID=A0A919L3R6_9ACTN|nr:non-ribosomal peptide synthetase/type I polyketide synthase [Streptomyces sulfonofaciens]GHH83875.1 hypothetical protein GCM10018793_47030 [Streptomyces sulfonofaciens]
MDTGYSEEVRDALAASVREIRQLRAELDKRAGTGGGEPVAIVGMGCRMPGGAQDPEAFWNFLIDGGNGITDAPASPRGAEPSRGAVPEAGAAPAAPGGFLADVDRFDAAFFGISPREAALLDPQQRLLLEVTWEALEHAGLSPDGLKGSDTGVFVGITGQDYAQQQIQSIAAADLEAYTLTGGISAFTAGRISYTLGLHGASLTLDTACSSALVAVHLACQSLRSGESAVALAGAANIILEPQWSTVLSKARMLSADGQCKTFDASADGYVRSEGAGVVVLKLLSEAVADGDPVLAVIRGSAVNNDGRSSGITVPNAHAQRKVVSGALRAAGVEPKDVSYVEAHGTGTALGDPIELRALDAVLGGPDRAEPLLVGSVKTNVGHLEAAAGMAGLIKTVMALRHEQIPPHLHLRQVNPAIGIDELGVRIPTAATPWPRSEVPRIAGVSSFGASGTNAHLVLSEAPSGDDAPATREPGRSAQLLVLSAKSPAALSALAERHREGLGQRPDAELADVCYTSATGRAHFPYRLAITGATCHEVGDRLAAAVADGEPGPGRVRGHAPGGSRPEVVFLFTGQSAQHPGMGRELYATEPVFRDVIDACDAVLRPALGRSLLSVLIPDPEDEDLIHETRFAQPVLFAFEYALAQLWRSWGVEPAAVLGHSIGELVAACVAGVIGLEDALGLTEVRGRLMQDLDEGAMASVFAPLDQVTACLPAGAEQVSVAAVNGPESVAIAGAPEAVESVLAELTRRGVRSVRMGSTRAFHSPLVDPMLDAFERRACEVAYADPEIPLVSNLTGALVKPGEFTGRYLRRHAREAVRFADGMQTLFDQGYQVFLEIGPSPTLLGMAKRFAPDAPADAPSLFLPSLRPGHDEAQTILSSLGALWAHGVGIDWDRFHAGRGHRRASLPTYPFQRERHWFEAGPRPDSVPRPVPESVPAPVPESAPDSVPRSVAEPGAPAGRRDGRPVPAAHGSPSLLGDRLSSPLEAVQYASRLDARSHPCLDDCVLDGLPVVNIGVYLEAAMAAAAQGHESGTLVVEECLVRQSLVLPHGESRNVQLVLEPSPTGRAAFRYFAEHEGPDGSPDWVLHAQGRVGVEQATAPAHTDVATLRRAMDAEVPGEDFYRRMWRRRLYLGSQARWIEHLHAGSGEVLARMREAKTGEADRYLLHPGTTDAMFQTLFACLPPDSPEDAAYMLMGIDRFTFRVEGAGAPAWCHSRLLPAAPGASVLSAEVTLLDDAGRTVVHAEGVYLKRAEREDVLRSGGTRQNTAPAVARPAAAPAAEQGPVEGTRPRAPLPAPAVPDVGSARGGDDVRDTLVRIAARILGSTPDAVDPTEPVQNLGLDSLMALQLKDDIATEFGVSLPLVSFLDGRSVQALGEEVAALVGGAAPDGAAAPASAAAPAPAPAPPAAPVEEEKPVRPPVLAADPSSRYEPFPLTDLQQAYLVGRTDAFELGSISTYLFIEVDVRDLDLVRLEEALRTLVERHDMLRAVITPDGRQRVLGSVPAYRIPVSDLRDLAEPERRQRLEDVHEQVRDQVIDPTQWPLFDIRATLVDERCTRLHIGIEALIADARSTSLLLDEWTSLYRDHRAELPRLPVTYRDYILAVRAAEDTPQYRAAEEYWDERIATLPPAPDLPLAKDPLTLKRTVFVHRSARLSPAEWTGFKEHAAAAGVTPSAALCTAYAQTLAAWSTSSHFSLNLLFFNRLPLHPAVGDLVGNFSATTLLEVDQRPTEDFTVRAARTQRQLWADLEHSQLSGVEVLRRLNRARGSAGRATAPVVFASAIDMSGGQGAGRFGLVERLTGLGTECREVSSAIRTPQVWLDHQVVEEADGLLVNWDVVEELFPEGLVDDMFAAYLDALRELCVDPGAWQRPAPVSVPTTALDVRQAANATSGPVPQGLLHDPFTARAAAAPERVAVIAADRRLTYGTVDRESNRVANWLVARGAAPGTLVGVVMNKGWEQIVAALGVLKSGAAYVPLDAGLPADRLRLLLTEAGISLVLTQSPVDEGASWPEDTVRLAVDTAGAADGGEEPPRCRSAAPDDLAYVIFTSGSTGTPKGVMIEHGAALNTIADVNDRFGVGPEDRVLALSALNFDLSVYDVFGMLAAGGAIVLPEPELRREPARWAELVSRHGVTVWNSVPALMELFTEHLLAEQQDEGMPLRLVMMSGDWIAQALPGRIRDVLPHAEVWSLGGATEASIWSILHRVDGVEPGWTSVPYGKPMRNQRFHVLDDALRPRPAWVPGMLYIAGHGLARGYLGDEAKTRSSFVRHPVTGERLYRTGDLGRYRPDGTIELLGREDHQVKVQGFRIELGEVETALLHCPGVRTAVAAVTDSSTGSKQLVAYVVPEEEASGRAQVTSEELRRRLGRVLPDYMVPQRIGVLARLPLSANGKVDRAALPAIGSSASATGENGATAPANDTERALEAIWEEFFDTRPIGTASSFFELGGDSMLAVRLMARIRGQMGVSLPVSTLFARQTIAQLAEVVHDAAASAREALVPIRTEGERPPLVLVHPVGGDVLCYAELAGLLGDDQPVYALQTPDTDIPLTTVADLAAHYAEVITAAVPEGPYRLGGWSMGGVVALEIARRLLGEGHQVDLVAVIDPSEPPGPSGAILPDEAAMLAWLGKDLAGIAGRKWAPTAESLREPAGESPLQAFHRRAVEAGALSADVDADTLAGIAARFSRNARALAEHRPLPAEVPVRFYRAADGGASTATAREWAALFPHACDIVDVPGNHYTVMRQPALSRLAEELRALLTGTAPAPADPGSSGARPSPR